MSNNITTTDLIADEIQKKITENILPGSSEATTSPIIDSIVEQIKDSLGNVPDNTSVVTELITEQIRKNLLLNLEEESFEEVPSSLSYDNIENTKALLAEKVKQNLLQFIPGYTDYLVTVENGILRLEKPLSQTPTPTTPRNGGKRKTKKIKRYIK